MAIIDLQRRLVRTGAIRLGNKIQKKTSDGAPAFDRSGRPIMIPNKLDTFRITSPHREVADAVAEQFGGQVLPWRGARGPEWEVITGRQELAVLVPNQIIDTNYEMWGPKLKTRFCDGAVERLRGVSCLCQRWDNHEHRFVGGKCVICRLDQKWQGEPHHHQFDMGECVICGCGRACKPTTRVNVMIQGIPGIGTFKVESHGINAAIELPTLAGLVASATKPLPALLGMRFEEPHRLRKSGEIEVRKFYVPELRFPWAVPEMMFATGLQLEAASREAVETRPVFAAIAATAAPTPEPAENDDDQGEARQLTREDILHLALTARTVEAVRALWHDAKRAGCLDKAMERLLADRATEVKRLEDAEESRGSDTDEVVDAEIIED
jgi:hypothetical protein